MDSKTMILTQKKIGAVVLIVVLAYCAIQLPRLLRGTTTASESVSLTDLFIPSEALLKRGNPFKSEVALTIDDGPHPSYLPKILKELRRAHVHGTFFEVGEMMIKSPALVQEVLLEGNEVGNHTMTHPRLTTVSPEQLKQQILDCAATFHSITGKKMTLFRPPGFRENRDILTEIKSLGYVTVGWNVGAHDYIVAGDFTPPDPALITEDIMKDVKMGSIILLHDAPGTAEALPGILSALKTRGLKVVTASELMKDLPSPVIVATNASADAKFSKKSL